MIAVTTERRGVFAIDEDHRASLKNGSVVLDYRIAPHIFVKVLGVKLED